MTTFTLGLLALSVPAGLYLAWFCFGIERLFKQLEEDRENEYNV